MTYDQGEDTIDMNNAYLILSDAHYATASAPLAVLDLPVFFRQNLTFVNTTNEICAAD